MAPEREERRTMPFLRLKNGPNRGERFEIGDNPLSLGRDPSCGIQILDKGASRQHAEVFRIGEMCFIRDLQSRNGTFVNDSKVDEELLREGDRIQIGATVIIFEGIADDRESGVEFSDSEEDFGQTLTLQLEDLSTLNVTSASADGSEALRLRALYKLSRLISDERDQEALISTALEFCTAQVSADAAYLFAPDPQKGNIVPVGNYSVSGKKGSKVSRSIIRRALQEHRAIMTNDAMQDARFSSRDSIMMKQIHSVICAPLSAHEEEISGAIYFASDSVQANFSEDDLELCAAMAQMLGLALQNFRSQREQRETLLSTIKVLVRASEMRDPTTRGHSERVATYATGIAVQLGLPEKQRNNIQLAGLLHDLGKLAVDDNSFFGASAMKDEGGDAETRQRKACMLLLGEMSIPKEVHDAIEFMDERYDGSGPRGKSGGDIPAAARVLSVAHEFDCRANQVSDERAEDLLRRAIVDLGKEGGYLFDAETVKALLIAHRNGRLYALKPEVSTESVIVDPRQNAPKNTAKGKL